MQIGFLKEVNKISQHNTVNKQEAEKNQAIPKNFQYSNFKKDISISSTLRWQVGQNEKILQKKIYIIYYDNKQDDFSLFYDLYFSTNPLKHTRTRVLGKAFFLEFSFSHRLAGRDTLWTLSINISRKTAEQCVCVFGDFYLFFLFQRRFLFSPVSNHQLERKFFLCFMLFWRIFLRLFLSPAVIATRPGSRTPVKIYSFFIV